MSCYTCRHRRISCDGMKPVCKKCQKRGLECLAKKPLNWVNGVAIRGKMMGRSFEDNHNESISDKATSKWSVEVTEGRLIHHRRARTALLSKNIVLSECRPSPGKFLSTHGSWCINYHWQDIRIVDVKNFCPLTNLVCSDRPSSFWFRWNCQILSELL